MTVARHRLGFGNVPEVGSHLPPLDPEPSASQPVRVTTAEAPMIEAIQPGGTMDRDEMLRLFETHRLAEAARDFDAILATFVEDCYIETVPLGLRSEGRAAARAAYEGYFAAFPDLPPTIKARRSATMSSWCGENSAEPAVATGWEFLRAVARLPCRSPTSPPSGTD